MKIKINHRLICLLSGILILSSCSDYLERTPEAEVTDKSIFGTFESFMGFIDYNYAEVLDPMHQYYGYLWYWGGEAVTGYPSYVTSGNKGEYWKLIGPSNVNYYYANRAQPGIEDIYSNDGIWLGGWRSIRRCNLALKNLPLLNTTEEKKKLIEGQLYFFRVWFHEQIIESFGGMPYIDTVYDASDILTEPRLTYQETAERIIEDLDKAIDLLPVNWDDTSIGQQSLGSNTGRVTKGAARALKAKFLLFAGSPLMNGFSGNDFNYNIEYCKRAAATAAEVIKMADNGVYSLVPFNKYHTNFHNSNDKTVVWTSETIWQKTFRQMGKTPYKNARTAFLPAYLGGSYRHSSATQNFVDRFEMADGTRYKVEYDNDENKRWKNRDPRFYQNFYVDRDKVGNHVNSVFDGYIGQESTARPGNDVESPYLIKKYLCWGLNDYDNQTKNYSYLNPIIRLAQVYLDYAEAVTVAYGPLGTAPGISLTAVDAVNIIRDRAGMPPVTAEAEGYNNFMELLRNERSVELAFESNHWFDVRRWYIAHLPENKELYTLNFDKDWTFFNRALHTTRIFENPKHYWLPIYRDQVQLYPEFLQNPGW